MSLKVGYQPKKYEQIHEQWPFAVKREQKVTSEEALHSRRLHFKNCSYVGQSGCPGVGVLGTGLRVEEGCQVAARERFHESFQASCLKAKPLQN